MDEQKIYQFWEEQGFFKANPNSTKKPYSLLMPPPNLTGELHLGHAMQHSIMDALARFKRMQGFDVLLLPGVDHAGILFEGTFNKKLEKESLSKRKLGREEWLKRAWEFKDQVYKSFHKTWAVMGVSADWSREVFTLEPKVQKAVLEEFKTFWEQDLLYKGAYIVQWCPKCGTAIEDIEMEYEERKERLYFVKYQVEGTDDYLVIATARPETIYADSGIAIYPKHSKFAKFVGRNAINPLNGNLLPIFEDSRVDKKFGTGALKITPGHDLLDFAIGQDNKLPLLHAVDKNGLMTELADDLVGLKVTEAREKSVEKLSNLGAIEKIENYTHSVPVCERCKTTVEPLISQEWFVKMKPLAEKALKNLGKVTFLPKNYHKIISDWYKEIHDWSISRSLWWGHRIPVWYCENCNPSHLVGKDKDIVISLEEPDKYCKSCSKSNWVQDDQTLDTWFSSGLWPMATLGWPFEAKTSQDKPSFENNMGKYFPWDFEISGPDIKYLWIARMIILGLHFTDNIPFKNMFFNGTLRDLQGRRFSKSLGNGIDPLELIETWGVDSVRIALYSYSVAGRDGKTSRQIMDERCKNFRNFGTKIRNVYRFIYELKPELININTPDVKGNTSGVSGSLRFKHDEDIEIIQFLNGTVDQVTKNLESFQLHLATEELYDFIWHKFADSYVEWSKKRRTDAQPCLEYVFTTCLKLLHPFMPFLTEELWQKIEPGKSIMTLEWPKSLR